ncbi:MAG: hypothetical protein ACI37S_06055 [Candidatus Gastranaerophilaceae bacterium]
MGMSASQARLLFITSRQHDVEFKSQQIANQKIRLATESEQIAADYSKALNKETLTMFDKNANMQDQDVTIDRLLDNGYSLRTNKGETIGKFAGTPKFSKSSDASFAELQKAGVTPKVEISTKDKNTEQYTDETFSDTVYNEALQSLNLTSKNFWTEKNKDFFEKHLNESNITNMSDEEYAKLVEVMDAYIEQFSGNKDINLDDVFENFSAVYKKDVPDTSEQKAELQEKINENNKIIEKDREQIRELEAKQKQYPQYTAGQDSFGTPKNVENPQWRSYQDHINSINKEIKSLQEENTKLQERLDNIDHPDEGSQAIYTFSPVLFVFMAATQSCNAGPKGGIADEDYPLAAAGMKQVKEYLNEIRNGKNPNIGNSLDIVADGNKTLTRNEVMDMYNKQLESNSIHTETKDIKSETDYNKYKSAKNTDTESYNVFLTLNSDFEASEDEIVKALNDTYPPSDVVQGADFIKKFKENSDYLIQGLLMGAFTLYDQDGKQVSLSSNQNFTTKHDKSNDAQAEADYNAKSAKIKTKEKILDNELNKLNTEHQALQTEYESAKNVISENVKRTFNMFS